MEYNDEIVEIVDGFTIAFKDYCTNIIINISNKKEYLQTKAAHNVFQDELNYSLMSLKKFKPKSILDLRKSILIKHFTRLSEQNTKMINTFEKEFSIESIKVFNDEVEKMYNLIGELMSELKK